MTAGNAIVIGVAGGSGAGKTTLARAVVEALGIERCVLLSQDRYYIDQSARFVEDGGDVNFDHPSALEFTLLAEHVQILARGDSVEVPVYDFASHTRQAKGDVILPRPIVVVDGTLILSQEVLRPHFQLMVFVDVPEKLRFERRLHRDTVQRGRTEEGVLRQWERQVAPMYATFIESTKGYADLILDGTADVSGEAQKVLKRLDVV